MLSAKRTSDGQTAAAYFASKSNGPFACLECHEEVLLRTGRLKINHFAHVNPRACSFATNESEVHRHCKLEIFRALQQVPGVSNVALERSLGTCRPDVSALIRGTPVAIEVQISSLSIETIMHRTIDYAQRGIYVLWLLQWTPELDARRYTPELWEKWVHAAYFGRVYYWLEGLTVVSYRFDPSFKSIPKTSWYSPQGKKMTGGGYSQVVNEDPLAPHVLTPRVPPDLETICLKCREKEPEKRYSTRRLLPKNWAVSSMMNRSMPGQSRKPNVPGAGAGASLLWLV